MRLDEVINLNHNDEFIFAVAVGKERDFMHCSLFYKWVDGQIRTLEFSSDQRVNSSRTIGDFGAKDYIYVLYNKDIIIDALAMQVPSICELIKENNNSINFGIKYSDTKFDLNGKLVYANGDFGLTCATFVLAILERAFITLVDLSDWEIRKEDLDIQSKMLEYYKDLNKKDSSEYSDDLLNHFEKNIGCFRYRPEEVAAATASPILPTNFKYCNEYGIRLKEAIENGVDFYRNTFLP